MKVYEVTNGFVIEYKGKTRGMGDGVGEIFSFRGKEVKVGEPNFVKAWQSHVNKNKTMYKEAYFGADAK